MARIKYTDDSGEHNGTLMAWEYFGCDKPVDIAYFNWQNTDYEPFKQAVNKKYNTTCYKAWLV